MRRPLTILTLIGAFFVGLKNILLRKGKKTSDAPDDDNREVSWKQLLWTTAKYFAAFAVLMAIGGFLLAASGIIPITASSGHWAITRWSLQFSKQRSVSTQTIGTDTPPLDDASLVLKGAGAFETNCRACHGSPTHPSPRVARHMTPRPPYLPTTLHLYDDAEVFYIVKHGIKFTGMPAWPAQQRDDEVWAMVAFLRSLAVIKAAEYVRLAGVEAAGDNEVVSMKNLLGPSNVPSAITESCGRCHGTDGLGRGTGAFPKLAGQNAEYLFNSLRAYSISSRHSGVMAPVAAGLNDNELLALARYYAMLDAPIPVVPADAEIESIEHGKRIALEGIPDKRIPSCVSCHGPNPLPRNPAYPELAGQYSDYLELQLQLFKQDSRGGTAYAHIMRHVAMQLSAQQVRDVSLYYSRQSPVKRLK